MNQTKRIERIKRIEANAAKALGWMTFCGLFLLGVVAFAECFLGMLTGIE